MKRTIGIVIVCSVIIFSFVLPIFYPYSQNDVFYAVQESFVNFAETAVREEYEIYSLYSDFIFPDAFSANIDKHISNAELNSSKEYVTSDGFIINKHLDGLYTVKIQHDSIYSRLEFLNADFEGVVAVATFYGIDFYDESVATSAFATANAEQDKAKLYLSADNDMQVYDNNGAPAGRLTNYIIRSNSGDDIFSIDQKNEIKSIIYNELGTGDVLRNGEMSQTIYCKSLGENIKYSQENSHIKLFRIEKKLLIDVYSSPSSKHLLGTDANGMDVLARLMYGGRTSIAIGIFSAIMCALLGVLLGCTSGYFGKIFDEIIMRLVDIIDCLPMFPVLVIAGSSMELMSISQGVRCAMIILIFTLTGFTGIARVVRSQILYLKKDISCIAVTSCGVSSLRKIVFHMLPSTMPQIVTFISMNICNFILAETSISFLGLGIKYPYSTWGTMISENCSLTELGNYPAIWISTASIVCITSIGFHNIGDAVFDKINAKGKCLSKKVEKKNGSVELSNSDNVIEVKNLNIVFHNSSGDINGVSNLTFSLKSGKAIAILGKSGSGKSATADSIMGLLPENVDATGSVLVRTGNGVIDMLHCTDDVKCTVRGHTIGYIMQEPMTCLNPVIRIGKQIEEVLKLSHSKLSKSEMRTKVYELLIDVGFEGNYERVYSLYPGELSGGMCQRVMIAIAKCLKPSVVIADEPCTALDICSKVAILKLIKNLMHTGTAVIFITHDINEAKYITDDILNIDDNEISTNSMDLLNYKPWYEMQSDLQLYPEFISINNISKSFSDFNLPNISFEVGKGECVGIAGEVGSGKTTLANIICGVINADSGYMVVDGKKYDLSVNKRHRNIDVGIQMVFQNPYASLSKHMTCGAQIKEAVHANRIVTRAEEREYVLEVMRMCGLGEEYYSRYPDCLSGGECQRVCIARAVALKPKLLICDEPLSALDRGMHLQIVKLLSELKTKHCISMIYITHDLSSLGHVADKVIFLSDKTNFIAAYREFNKIENVAENKEL